MSVPVVEGMRLHGKISELNNHIYCTSNYDILIAMRQIDKVSPSVVEGMGLLGKTSEVTDEVLVVVTVM